MSLRNARVRKILAASGAQVGVGGVRRTGIFALRYATNSAALAPGFSGITFRQVWQVPFVGRCLVRAVYETAQATPAARTTAFAAGRSIADVNPIAADGTPAIWTVSSATTPPAGGESIYAWGRGKSDAIMLDIPAPTDGGAGGYIYTSTAFASSSGADMLSGNAARPITDWGVYINSRLAYMKYRSWRNNGDYVTTNQNGMPDGTEDHPHPVAWLEITPLAALPEGWERSQQGAWTVFSRDGGKQWLAVRAYAFDSAKVTDENMSLYDDFAVKLATTLGGINIMTGGGMTSFATLKGYSGDMDMGEGCVTVKLAHVPDYTAYSDLVTRIFQGDLQ